MQSSTWFISLACLSLAACAPGPDSPAEPSGSLHQALFTDNGFEGDTINVAPPAPWVVTAYQNPNPGGYTPTTPQTLATLNLTPNAGVAATVVVGGATTESQPDPDLGAGESLRYPKYGLRSAVVNWSPGAAPNNGANNNVNSLKQQMIVGNSDVDPKDNQIHVRFVIAPVLQNPAHTVNQQPYFYVQLLNVTTGKVVYQDFNFSSQPSVPWKTVPGVTGGAANYTDWQLVDINAGSANISIGDNVELFVLAAGCALGAHWGRVYVDGFGQQIPGLYVYATGPQNAKANTNITYTLNYTNGGAVTAQGATVTLVSPPNTTFTSVSIPGCTVPAVGAAGTITCPVGALAPGASGSFQITVHITAGSTGSITNGNYFIQATNVTPLLGPKVVTTIVAAMYTFADISITKTDGLAGVAWGQALTYTIKATNAGPAAAPSVAIVDTMPAQLTGVTWTCVGAGGGTCPAMGAGNINSVVNLPVGASVTYTVKANVVAGMGTGSVLNTVTATINGMTVEDPDDSNNSAGQSNQIGTLRTLTVMDIGGGTGTVTSTPTLINCGATCTGSFVDGQQVLLTATPAPGSTFAGWGGACAGAGSAKTCTVTMAGNQNVTASFVLPPVVVAPANMSVINKVKPVISGTGPVSATINVIIDGVVAGTAMSDAMGNWTFTPPMALALGAHTVTSSALVGSGMNTATTPTGNTNSFTIIAGCLTNADCMGGTPVCVVATHMCVRCVMNTDCPMGATCNAMNQCVLPPPVVITPADMSVTNSLKPPITGTAPANATVTVSIDGVVVGTTTADGMGNWTFTPPMNLSVGPHTVSATDSVGMAPLAVTSAPSNTNRFTVIAGCLTNADCMGATPVCLVATHMCVRCVMNTDCPMGATCNAMNQCVLPPPVVITPADMSVTNNSKPPITGTAPANATVTVSIDGVVVGTTTADAMGNWTFTPPMSLSIGPHTVSATDTLGMAPLAVTSGPSNTNGFTVIAGCLTNADCMGGTPVCLVATHMCVRCVMNTDCPMGATCNPMNQCVLPPPVVLTPADMSVTNNPKPPITGTAPPNATVNVSIDGVVVGTTTADAMGNWTFTPPANLTPGPHTVSATDTLGTAPLDVTSGPSNTNSFTVINGCLKNADCVNPNAAFCNLANHTCVGCNGDNGSGQTYACPDPMNPYCGADGICRKCGNNGDCAGHPAGPICNRNTGSCGNACAADSDCSAAQFCNFATMTCVPKVPNGGPVPTDPPHNPNVLTGTCGQQAGAITCASGVCSPTDNRCGLPNGTIAVDKNGMLTMDPGVCRSNFINVDGKCGQPNSDPVAGVMNTCVDPNPAPAVTVECRSGVCFSMAGVANLADNQCGLPNGEPCADNGTCRTVCVAADAHCGLLNGTPCTSAAQCRSNVCNADGKCGDPNGTPCVKAVTCRSAICDAAMMKCGPFCATDNDCASSAYCDATSKSCVDKEPNGSKTGPIGDKTHNCDRVRQCVSVVCNADGECGDPDGTACVTPTTCRTGKCTNGKCGVSCTVDADCGAGFYCEDSLKLCTPSEPNGSPTGPAGMKTTNCDRTRAVAECQSAQCNADGKCGDPDGTACVAAKTCRSGACVSGTCGSGCKPGGAGGDAQCAPPFFCSGTAIDPSGTCKPDAPNGGKPDGKNCDRPSECVSNVCYMDGACGLPDGQPCISVIECRSGVCLGGLCGATTGCTNDTQCPEDKYCASGTCTPKKPNSMPCMTGHECISAFCHPDGKCGVPTGDPCGNSLLCRSNLCDPVSQKCADCITDATCGGLKSGKVCDGTTHMCIDGCRGMNGNGCPDPNLCTSPDATIGQCVQCKTDDTCGNKTSGRICEKNKCQDGCRGSGGNGCPVGDQCSSRDTNAGVCSPLGDMAMPADMGMVTGGVLAGGGLGGCAVGGHGEAHSQPLQLALVAFATLLVAARRRRR